MNRQLVLTMLLTSIALSAQIRRDATSGVYIGGSESRKDGQAAGY
jgi:hypothetical protein